MAKMKEAVSTVEGSANGKGPKVGSFPTYSVAPVDMLPEQKRAGGQGRTSPYTDLLNQVADYPNTWCEIATFKTATGATVARKALEDGKRNVQLPDGDWEFDTRRFGHAELDEVPEGQRWSKLYAKVTR